MNCYWHDDRCECSHNTTRKTTIELLLSLREADQNVSPSLVQVLQETRIWSIPSYIFANDDTKTKIPTATAEQAQDLSFFCFKLIQVRYSSAEQSSIE